MGRFNPHAARDLAAKPTADRQRGPAEVCRDAAELLERLAPRSTEARRTADDLRRLARALADLARRPVRTDEPIAGSEPAGRK